LLYFSLKDRQILIDSTSNKSYDLIVIGGGITGAGIALDAATRGLGTILLEKNDFSSGTSSKSTKLIHGGLRYLKQFEIALVREIGKERAIVHRLAPHLVTSEKMLLPLTEDGTFGKLMTSVGLMVYDILAGVESADQRVMLDADETLKKEPLLNKDEVIGSGLYAEYKTDDSRLTIEVIKTAVESGATCINYAEVTNFQYKDDIITGVVCRDTLSGNQFEVSAKKIVSAAGPWVDDLRSKDGPLKGKKLHLTKGVHLVFPHEKLPVKQAIYFDVPDDRMIFAIPRGKVTYVGTTDTNYTGNKDKILTDKEDAQYLIDALNNMFTGLRLTVDDVASSWAGVRPLIHEEGKSASELSRKDEIFESESGLLSIAGGKLTGYRKMAERITDLVMEKLCKEDRYKFVKCLTNSVVLHGGPFENATEVKSYSRELIDKYTDNISGYNVRNLVATYGRQADMILEQYERIENHYDDKEEALLVAEIQYCLENEMTVTVLDFVVRRTGRLLFDIESVRKYADTIIETMSKAHQWTDLQDRTEKEALETAIWEACEVFK